jgi:hypothetical protein
VAYTSTSTPSRLTKSTPLDGRKYDIALADRHRQRRHADDRAHTKGVLQPGRRESIGDVRTWPMPSSHARLPLTERSS